MQKIVIIQPVGLTDTQLAELKTLGEVIYHDTISKDANEWLERAKGADIIYTNIFGFEEAWRSLRDVFVTLPFVGVGFLGPKILAEHNVTVSRSPGCNQVAVSEWIVGMLLNYSRQLPEFVKVTHFDRPTPFYTHSLFGKTVCIMGGAGYIGARTGKMLEAFGMNVRYFKRDDNMESSIKDADFVVDCLSLNSSTEAFYDDGFFSKLKDATVFVTVSSNKTKDMDALLKHLENGKLAHYITDNAQAMLFDTEEESYKALLDNPKVTITPHIAAYTDNTRETAAKMCIENIKAHLAGKPINVVGGP